MNTTAYGGKIGLRAATLRAKSKRKCGCERFILSTRNNRHNVNVGNNTDTTYLSRIIVKEPAFGVGGWAVRECAVNGDQR